MRRLLVLGTVLAVAASAVAAAETRIYSNAHRGSFPVKPAKLVYAKSQTGAGESVTLTKLDWRDWGDGKAESDGRLQACPSRDSCFVTDAEVKAKRKQRIGDASYYTRLVVFFGQNRIKIRLPTPSS